jgi:cytochrome P450
VGIHLVLRYQTVGSFGKDKRFYGPENPIHPGVYNMVLSNDEDHARVRKIFSSAFSDTALKRQQPLFLQHVDLLVSKLHQQASGKVDLVAMLNFTTFDIMGDLTFGEPLGLLDGSAYSPWVQTVFAGIKANAFFRIGLYYPLLMKALSYLVPQSLRQQRLNHMKYSYDRVDRRLAQESSKPDIWSLTTREDEDGQPMLSLAEMHLNSSSFMIAGTETSATLLSGLNFYLLKNRRKYELLTDEIRNAFTTTHDMTFERLGQLKYLNACLEEALRMYPPVPTGFGRFVPEGGAMVSDYWVPGGVSPPIFYHRA